MKTILRRITAPRKWLPRGFPGASAGTKKANGVSKDSTPWTGELRVIIRQVFAAIQEEKP
jgi:hypothetical protein